MPLLRRAPSRYLPPAIAGEIAPGETCVTCGTPSATPYCATCGERRAADRPHTLRALVEEILDAFSPVDGRIGRTVWALVRRPGLLTVEYMRGVRLPYVPPLRLFLLVNVLYFVFSNAVDVHAFDTPLAVQLGDERIAGRAERMVIHRLAERDITYKAYAETFDARATTQAQSLVLLMVPAFAAAVGVLGWRRSREALRHLAFALHTYTVLMLAAMVIEGAFIGTVRWLAKYHLAWLRAHPTALSLARSFDDVVTTCILSLMALWLWRALRRAYGDSRLFAAMKALVLLYAMGEILYRYRDLLFFTVFYTT